MASKSSLKNMALCLSLVCLVCSALLAVTYAVTVEPIAAAAQAKTNATIAKVLPAFSGDPVLGTVEVEGAEYPYYKTDTGYAVMVTTSGFGGPLTVMVGVDNDGIIHNTAVLSHSETPGLGAKCGTDEKFIGQFRGFDPKAKKLVVKNDGGDVDAITASTITSRAYTLAVAVAVKASAVLNGSAAGSDAVTGASRPAEPAPAETVTDNGGQENE